MERISHRLIMLKPMRAGADGYARLQSEGGRTLLQIHARGLSAGSLHAYWYAGGGEARDLGSARVNARGEAALTAEAPEDGLAPERLKALILVSGGEEPAPLLIGLCVQQSAGSLLDAKNAALALCERLSRSRRSRERREAAFPTPQVAAAAAPRAPEEKAPAARRKALPRRARAGRRNLPGAVAKGALGRREAQKRPAGPALGPPHAFAQRQTNPLPGNA